MQLLYVAFLQTFGCTWYFPDGISSVPDRLKIYGGKIQVIPKRDTHLDNLGRGDRCTKFEVNRTNIKSVPSISSVHVELHDRLSSTADRTDETTKEMRWCRCYEGQRDEA